MGSQEVSAPDIEFRLFDRFVVLRGGAEVAVSSFGGRKVRALLRILVTRRGAFVAHDVLSELLWPDRQPFDPAANLQVLVNRARRAVGRPDLIITGPGGYALSAEPWLVVDVECYLTELHRCALLEGEPAVRAYRAVLETRPSEPLAEDRYESWALAYVDEVRQARQSAWERAAALALDTGQPALAVAWARAAFGAEPLREVAASTLARALAAAGDPAAALAVLAACRRRLAQDLGIDPSPEVAELQRQLLRSEVTTVRAPTRPERRDFGELAFVGREVELDTIRRALELEPAPVLAVTGRSGSGKSRLLAEVARGTLSTAALGVRAFWADRDEPWALGRLVLGELAAVDYAAVDALPEQLRTALATVLPDLTPGVTPLDPVSRQALVLEAAVRLTGLLDRPLLLVDDLQWADSISLRLLAAVHDRVPGLRLVMAYRPEDVAPDGALADALGRTLRAITVPIGPLPQSALDRLMVAPDVAAALGEHTDRSALAVTEVVRELAVSGMIAADDDGRWGASAPDLARTVAELGRRGQRRAIVQRAARHTGVGRAVLSALALLGREASARLLASAVSASETEILDALGRLADADLVRQRQHGWGLVHDAVGTVLADELSDADRSRWQSRLAGALGDDGGDGAERARLWRAAGDPVRATDAYAIAARRALESFADDEAERLAEDGLALTDGSGNLAPRRCALREARALARQRKGDLAGARSDLTAALQDAGPGPRRAVLYAELATLVSGSDDLVRASELAELAVVEAGPGQAARARALEVASVIDMNLDRTGRARHRAATALRLYGELGDSHGAARILDARAMATFLASDIRRGTELLDRAAHLFADSGDLMRLVTPRSTRGHGLVLLGRPSAGLADADAALDIARTLGQPEGQAYALWHRGEALAALGRPQQALAAGREALSIATRIGHRGWTATSWRTIGLAEQCAGEAAAALQAYRRSLEAAEHLDLFACWAAARAALMHLELGDSASAASLAGRALVTGPPLGRHEARWADAALAVRRHDARRSTAIERAVSEARHAGALIYLPELEALRLRG